MGFNFALSTGAYYVILKIKVSWVITSTKNVLMPALNVQQSVIIVHLPALQSRM